jgi:hypothetical protein
MSILNLMEVPYYSELLDIAESKHPVTSAALSSRLYAALFLWVVGNKAVMPEMMSRHF